MNADGDDDENPQEPLRDGAKSWNMEEDAGSCKEEEEENNDDEEDDENEESSVFSNRSCRSRRPSIGLPYTPTISRSSLHDNNNNNSNSSLLLRDSITTVPLHSSDDTEHPALSTSLMLEQLFRVWDLDSSGTLDQGELFRGIEAFVGARGLRLNMQTMSEVWDEVTDTEDQGLNPRQFSLFLARFADTLGVSTQDTILAFMEILSDQMANQPMIPKQQQQQQGAGGGGGGGGRETSQTDDDDHITHNSKTSREDVLGRLLASGMAWVDSAADQMPSTGAEDVIVEDNLELLHAGQMLSDISTWWTTRKRSFLDREKTLSVLQEGNEEEEEEEEEDVVGSNDDSGITKEKPANRKRNTFKTNHVEAVTDDTRLHSADQMWGLVVGAVQKRIERSKSAAEAGNPANIDNARGERSRRSWRGVYDKLKVSTASVLRDYSSTSSEPVYQETENQSIEPIQKSEENIVKRKSGDDKKKVRSSLWKMVQPRYTDGYSLFEREYRQNLKGQSIKTNMKATEQPNEAGSDTFLLQQVRSSSLVWDHLGGDTSNSTSEDSPHGGMPEDLSQPHIAYVMDESEPTVKPTKESTATATKLDTLSNLWLGATSTLSSEVAGDDSNDKLISGVAKYHGIQLTQ